ncbi:MAG TPA: response regulator transcription factor [Thermoanaerobaculia bacterium]|nr:response regulator transcription factor [Thermoanaerobaculia bacterium]
MPTTPRGTASPPAPPPPKLAPPLLRVLLLGDDPLARGGLAYLLAGEPGFEVVAQADAAGAAAAVEREDPQVAVWDLGVDPPAWLERLGDLGETGPPAVALLLDEEAAAAALAAGARGLLFRDVEAGRLAAALRALAGGLLIFDDALLPPLLRPPPAPQTQPEPLTPRELEVVQLLAQGLSNRRIAERLGISEHTAKFHVNAIVGKLGAQTRTDAAIRAARLGLVLL